MKILITGSNGLLGQKIISSVKDRVDVELIATSTGDNRVNTQKHFTYYSLDITDRIAVRELVQKEKPDAVINTAAMTNVDACEDNREACYDLNVNAVKYLIDACKEVSAHFIHVSTDFIFKGDKGPYKESDIPSPVNYYGETKLEAERLVQNSGLKNWVVARTIILYGVGEGLTRGNIVLWAKEQLENEKPIQMVDDQFRSPTLAEDLAKGCLQIAEQKVNGVYHLSGPEYLSMYDLVMRIADYWKLDKSLVKRVQTGTFTQRAERPLNTGFDISKARKDFGYNPCSLEESFALIDSQHSE